MQTVEAIQISASRAPGDSPENEFPVDDSPMLSGLEELARGSVGNGDNGSPRYFPPRSSSGFQALIKRVVELTTELSSQVCCVLTVCFVTRSMLIIYVL
jgi:hypothetical protein